MVLTIMRTAVAVAIFALSACCIPSPSERAPADELRTTDDSAPVLDMDTPPDQEPPLQLVVASGEHTVHTLPGRPVRLGDGPDAPEITVRIHPHRVFDQRGLRFPYPHTYGFEAEIAPDLEEWVLSGNDHRIMVFFYPGVADPEAIRREVVADMASRFGPATRVEPVSIALGGRDYAGDRILATVVSEQMRVDAVGFPATGGAWVLLLQDNGFGGSAEGAATMAILARELRRE